jgi:hypothetical protein
MKSGKLLVVTAFTALVMGGVLSRYWSEIDPLLWRREVSPGPLSAPHAWLESDCAACHTPLRSAEATKCIGCHANEVALLQRQPTAFHASIAECSACHVEHRAGSRPVSMDHAALAEVGLAMLRRAPESPSTSRLLGWIEQHGTAKEARLAHPAVTPAEAALDCMSCHSTKDRHQGYFGGDCASCHLTSAWALSDFRHPSPRSQECVQCHQAPPSHYMMHFEMVSQHVAGEHSARLDQCFRCHQTTSWNDIRGVGWYKHH